LGRVWAWSLNWDTGGKQESCQNNANGKFSGFHRSFLSVRRQVDTDGSILLSLRNLIGGTDFLGVIERDEPDIFILHATKG